MIKFHKIAGLPKDQEPNQEHIWFTSEGSIHVTDNDGHPIQMGMGFKNVPSIPSGTPPSAGLLRYCTANRKYYFSTEVEWRELMTESRPGSQGGPGYAGGVLLADSANYFTSGDVEGALFEIAEAINPLLGQKNLRDFTGDVLKNKSPGEWRILAQATNKPSGLATPAWHYQRKDKDGNVLGYIIGRDGTAYIRHGDTFTRLVNYQDIESLKTIVDGIKGTVNGIKGTVDSLVLKVGDGLKITDGGRIGKSPTLTLDMSIFESGEESGEGEEENIQDILGFVKTTGDTMTGTLNINGKGEFKMFSDSAAVMSLQTNVADGRMTQLIAKGADFKISDPGTGISPMRWNASEKRLYLNELDSDILSSGQINSTSNWGKGVLAKGPLQVENYSLGRRPNETPSNQFALYVDNKQSNLAIFRSSDAGLAIRNQESSIRLESITPGNDGTKNMILSGRHGSNMNTFKVAANESRFLGNLYTTRLSIGASHTDIYGTVNPENKILLYPRKIKSGMSTEEGRKHVVQIGYQQNRDVLEILAYKRTTSNDSAGGWSKKPLTLEVASTKFTNTSSEEYKTNIVESDIDAIKALKEVKVFEYEFKADEDKERQLGFIIERDVPEIAIGKGGKTIDSYAMLAILWKATKELNEKVERLEAELDKK